MQPTNPPTFNNLLYKVNQLPGISGTLNAPVGQNNSPSPVIDPARLQSGTTIANIRPSNGLYELLDTNGNNTFSFTATVVNSAVGGSQNKKLQVVVGGVTYYIPLNTA